MSELISDDELLRRMRQGQQAAFATLYQRHHAALYRYAVLRCGSTTNAADVVQDVFMRLLNDGLNYDSMRGELRFYLFGVARKLALKFDYPSTLNESATVSEDEEWTPEIACDAPDPLERLFISQMAEQTRVAIAALSPHYRDVLILFEMQELSYLEIAEICQINVGTVRSRLSRARHFLAQQLAHYQSGQARVA